MNKQFASPKHFVALWDYSAAEIKGLLDLADNIKKSRNEYRQALAGKTLGMIFNKNSTRTRISFEVGIYQLGGIGLFFGPNQLQTSRGETVSDTAKVLSRYLDGIMIRTFAHKEVTELAANSSIPVINGLTDYNHPCQVLADLMTIREKFGKLEGLKLTYVGDSNNMTVSLLSGCVRMGMHMSVVSPKGFQIPASEIERVKSEADKKGLRISVTDRFEEGLDQSDIVYTDTWISMGQESENEKRVKAFKGYTIDNRMMAMAKKSAIFMHCLPAHRGEEVANEVMDGPQSVIFDEAENRLHAQKAVMLTLMK